MSRESRRAAGLLSGMVTAIAGGGYFVFSRAGVIDGLGGSDLAFLRYATAALLLLPFMLSRSSNVLGRIAWPRALILTGLAGPIFSYLQVGGLQFAPLAHGSIIMPASVTLSSKLLSIVFDDDKIDTPSLVGIALIVLGLLLIEWDGLSTQSSSNRWIGDLMFLAAGVLWATYNLQLKRWNADPLSTTGVVAVLGTAAMLPFYVAAGGTEHLFHATASTLGWQLLGQGVVGGLVMFVAYGRTVVLLGPAQAGLFPSFVPCFAVLFGIPFLGELPTLPQLAGLAVVTFGILTAVGLVPPPRLGKADRGGARSEKQGL
jgi:drug/metabolite transporter (DMT)-like permease